jgi:transposase
MEEYGLLMFMQVMNMTAQPRYIFLPTSFVKINAFKRFTVIRPFRRSDYNGVFARKMKEFGIEFKKASRPESTKGFVPVAKRWVVERTIAWTNFFRRIVKDYEYTVSSSVAWILLANIQLMLQRIKPINQT